MCTIIQETDLCGHTRQMMTTFGTKMSHTETLEQFLASNSNVIDIFVLQQMEGIIY